MDLILGWGCVLSGDGMRHKASAGGQFYRPVPALVGMWLWSFTRNTDGKFIPYVLYYYFALTLTVERGGLVNLSHRWYLPHLSIRPSTSYGASRRTRSRTRPDADGKGEHRAEREGRLGCAADRHKPKGLAGLAPQLDGKGNAIAREHKTLNPEHESVRVAPDHVEHGEALAKAREQHGRHQRVPRLSGQLHREGRGSDYRAKYRLLGERQEQSRRDRRQRCG
eukprot:scaffold28835_cov63-Phaeocystis_antarctica.AAC.5